MAIVLETSGFNTNALTSSVTNNFNLPSGLSNALLLVVVQLNNNNFETVSSLTWNGTGLTFWQTDQTKDDARIEIWYLKDPESGTHDLVTTYNTSIAEESIVGYLVLSGVEQAGTPLSGWVIDAAQSGDTTPSVTVTCNVDDLIVASMLGENVGSLTTPGDMTEIWNTSVAGQTYGACAYKFADATSEVINYTMGGSDHRILAGFAVAPASAPTELNIFVHDCGDVGEKIG